MNVEQKALLTSVLRDVSRSFYLTIRVLPSSVRRPIAIAYLLARATDTIADTQIVKLPIRLDALQRLRARIEGVSEARLDFGGFAQQQGTPGERILLQRVEDVLRLFSGLDTAERTHVKSVLKTIVSGQELDLERFTEANSKNIIPLQKDAELDDYTYRVAGCVGEFWTNICLAAHRWHSIDDKRLLENSVRFGKGLQLVNILRDIPADLKNGRCYIPIDLLTPVGLAPANLLEAGNINQFRPVYDQLLKRAEDHLAAGWEYTNTLPFGWVRIRLACAWPILIGVQTIARLREQNPLDAANRIKISRPEVRSIICRSAFNYPFRGSWNRQFDHALRRP